MADNYAFKEYGKDNMARALGRALPISFKQSIEICNFIRHKNVSYAKDVLGKAIRQDTAIPFRRFNHNTGHKRKIAAGRYPKKASEEILNLINSAEANAQFKGLNTANLVITHINANKSSKVTRIGRKRNRSAKRTNVEIVVQERKATEKAANKRRAKTDNKETNPKQGEK